MQSALKKGDMSQKNNLNATMSAAVYLTTCTCTYNGK